MKGFDPNALFAQARKMKDEMAKVEKDLEDRMVEGKAAGGMVSVVCNGNSELQVVRIKPDAVDPDDLSLLEDLVMVAVKEALEKARAIHDEAMEKASGGLGLGGLPF